MGMNGRGMKAAAFSGRSDQDGFVWQKRSRDLSPFVTFCHLLSPFVTFCHRVPACARRGHHGVKVSREGREGGEGGESRVIGHRDAETRRGKSIHPDRRHRNGDDRALRPGRTKMGSFGKKPFTLVRGLPQGKLPCFGPVFAPVCILTLGLIGTCETRPSRSTLLRQDFGGQGGAR